MVLPIEVHHAQLQMHDSVLLLSRESPEMHLEIVTRTPETLGGTTLLFELDVDDVDAQVEFVGDVMDAPNRRRNAPN